MIKFKYVMSNDIFKLLEETIINYNNNYLIGYLYDEDKNTLNNTSLYLMCECIEKNNRKEYKNPIAVVSRNQYSAVEMFYDITKENTGVVLCELARRCDNLVVEQIE